jgi:hypothetical protein
MATSWSQLFCFIYGGGASLSFPEHFLGQWQPLVLALIIQGSVGGNRARKWTPTQQPPDSSSPLRRKAAGGLPRKRTERI